MNGGEQVTPSFTIKPEDASITTLEFESSKPEVASVNEQGVIEGTGTGTAVITAKATDGSGKSTTINVKVVDNRIPQNIAMKAVLVGICNDRSDDIFTADGNGYDKRKFHNYNDAVNMLSVVEPGEWSSSDGGNSWYVSNIIVSINGLNGFHKYSFDVTYDGKNYSLENGIWNGAAQMKYLDGSDDSKLNEELLSNLEYYTYLVVSPKQITD